MVLFPWQRGAYVHESVSHSLTYESTCCAVYENSVTHSVSLLSPYKDPYVGPGDNTIAMGKSYSSYAALASTAQVLLENCAQNYYVGSCLFEKKSQTFPTNEENSTGNSFVYDYIRHINDRLLENNECMSISTFHLILHSSDFKNMLGLPYMATAHEKNGLRNSVSEKNCSRVDPTPVSL